MLYAACAAPALASCSLSPRFAYIPGGTHVLPCRTYAAPCAFERLHGVAKGRSDNIGANYFYARSETIRESKQCLLGDRVLPN